MTLGGLVPVIFIENLYGFQQLGFYYLATTILFGPNSFLMRSFGDVFFQRLGDRKKFVKKLSKNLALFNNHYLHICGHICSFSESNS